jgi:hypothetical protein
MEGLPTQESARDPYSRESIIDCFGELNKKALSQLESELTLLGYDLEYVKGYIFNNDYLPDDDVRAFVVKLAEALFELKVAEDVLDASLVNITTSNTEILKAAAIEVAKVIDAQFARV